MVIDSKTIDKPHSQLMREPPDVSVSIDQTVACTSNWCRVDARAAIIDCMSEVLGGYFTQVIKHAVPSTAVCVDWLEIAILQAIVFLR